MSERVSDRPSLGPLHGDPRVEICRRVSRHAPPPTNLASPEVAQLWLHCCLGRQLRPWDAQFSFRKGGFAHWNAGQCLPHFGRFGPPRIAQLWAGIGQSQGPDRPHTWPGIGQAWPGIGQLWPKHRPTLVRTLPSSTLARIRPTLANFDKGPGIDPKYGPSSTPSMARFGPNLGHLGSRNENASG